MPRVRLLRRGGPRRTRASSVQPTDLRALAWVHSVCGGVEVAALAAARGGAVVVVGRRHPRTGEFARLLGGGRWLPDGTAAGHAAVRVFRGHGA